MAANVMQLHIQQQTRRSKTQTKSIQNCLTAINSICTINLINSELTIL